jgi:polysaccharide deacetylase family protein (PEP-CTERM system associated)
MLNALSIDVEDYFQVQAFSGIIPYEAWGQFQTRVERNTFRLLDILNDPGIGNQSPPRATFFILGWIAGRYPQLVREIYAQGHEIACHGYAHKPIYQQSEETFRKDIRRAKAILEDIIGEEVVGYRAPSYSITRKSLWALEVLKEEGFKYDSSIFPIKHDLYGLYSAPRHPFRIAFNGNQNGDSGLWEFPLSTARILSMNLPVSGGGYFRLFPYSLVKKELKKINQAEGKPFVFYVHPWELDPQQPRIRNAGIKSRFRHYINLDKTEDRLKDLIKTFQFAPLKKVLGENLSTRETPNQRSIQEL